jgi:hypothetical protein
MPQRVLHFFSAEYAEALQAALKLPLTSKRKKTGRTEAGRLQDVHDLRPGYQWPVVSPMAFVAGKWSR